MSRDLLNSNYFPQIGGAGAQRPLKLARYLHAQGHEVVVLTGSGETGQLWTPADATLELDVPSEVPVVRVPGPEPGPAARLRCRTERILALDTEWEKWWRAGSQAAGANIGDFDVIHTIMSPYSSAEPSFRLSQELGIGWIADLGDPWALDEMLVYPTRVHRRLEIRRMRRWLRTAAAVVMSTPEAVRQVLHSFPELADRPVVAISNGYDASDFTDTEPVSDDPTKFRIVHTGYLHTELGLQQRDQSLLRRLAGGGMPGVDILTRSHIYLLEAVDRLFERDPGLRGRLEIHLAGVFSETDRELASRSQVTVLHGYLSHAESIELMRSADLLFLPLQKLPSDRRSSTVPGKTYEYLAAGRPILGALPHGDARDILEASGRAYICEPDDVESIATAIAKAMVGEVADDRAVDPEFIKRFSYEKLAGDVASVIEEVAGVQSGGVHAYEHST